jgi:hypothetical protein
MTFDDRLDAAIRYGDDAEVRRLVTGAGQDLLRTSVITYILVHERERGLIDG